ncbi:ERMES complex subunit [Agyrium rufum]|nr:ERMES complex subunit [Agyrium rufum]
MAFNFNWSPLTADTTFYDRAKVLLTTALNKYPKPPIIVDDILVNELNLGSVPPDLEILEVGDLAEDRFRGIFKMCYNGDAFLTLKTKVQANPLSTFLSTTPSFTSPQPLAASSGLTIPLQITLSDIKLAAFIILVFSRQKGLTLVFRNDPLESLKVSSTFDSIPFVRDYLQKEIEGQLRTLLMDELPAIIHRLSLQLLVPEQQVKGQEVLAPNTEGASEEEPATDPLALPPQDAVDSSGQPLDPSQIASLSLESGADNHALFSQKTLLRLAALTNSHRTLSLFTPSMKDVVFRAWAGPTERGESYGHFSPAATPQNALSRRHTYNTSFHTSNSVSDFSDSASLSSRPPMTAFHSTNSGLNLTRHSKPGRKRKNRVVNLRRTKTGLNDNTSSTTDSPSISATPSSAGSEAAFPLSNPSISEEREGELVTLPGSPHLSMRFQRSPEKVPQDPSQSYDDLRTPRASRILVAPERFEEAQQENTEFVPPSPPPAFNPHVPSSTHQLQPARHTSTRPTLRPTRYFASYQYPTDKPSASSAGPSLTQEQNQQYAQQNQHYPTPYQLPHNIFLQGSEKPSASSSTGIGSILEQAWMMKMAGEIARRAQEQDEMKMGYRSGANGDVDMNIRSRMEEAPPAYGA